ncbi:unnamed protein product [Durusdinium trenchii]|uniref:Ricin B lectin domain-containing protein n=1 Tax=Durusdinium trenchii TaxID=1381693 RepID=A0ABP0R073_9DINO
MHSCHGGSNQRFIWNGEQLQSEANTNKCLDYSFGSGNVVIWDCHGGNNQKWYWDNGRLKSRHDHFCLDVLPSNNNVFVGSCSGINTQHWQQLSSLHNSAQLTIGGGKCLRYNAQVHNNVEAAGCSETPGTMWYFNNNHRLQTEENDKCLDVHTSTGNLYMGDCHGGWNQKFYFDGHLLKTMHQDDLCLDYNVANGNVYTGSCPHHNMFNFKMQGGAMLKKMPLPKEYQHGQTLDVSCWSERFASSSSEALSCVAGVWMNSRGKKGLDGFSCAACVQVVTPRYADLDSQIRQELFFAAGMELHLTVDTRIRRSVTANGQLREGGSRDVFVAEMLPDAAETTRRYRSITNGGQCLTMSNGRLGSSACAREAEPQQMIEAMELSSLMWEEFKAGANVPAPTTSYLANRGSGLTTLRSLVLFQAQLARIVFHKPAVLTVT